MPSSRRCRTPTACSPRWREHEHRRGGDRWRISYIELVTLTEITRRDSGELWQIGRYDLRNPRGEPLTELDRLDDDATLLIATLDGHVLSLADDRVRPPPAPEPIVADTPELLALRDGV